VGVARVQPPAGLGQAGKDGVDLRHEVIRLRSGLDQPSLGVLVVAGPRQVDLTAPAGLPRPLLEGAVRPDGTPRSERPATLRQLDGEPLHQMADPRRGGARADAGVGATGGERGGHAGIVRPVVPDHDRVQFREAGAHDAAPVAALHADSWRRNYRGAYADTFLDGDVLTERLAFWTARLGGEPANRFTILAEESGSLVGFAHSVLDEDPTWGAYLDNLHVAHTHQGQGLGTRLMALTARAVIQRRPSSGLYLWVLEQNVRAQRFYEARGGSCVGRDLVHPPGGDPSRLCGDVPKLRYAWSDPTRLLG